MSFSVEGAIDHAGVAVGHSRHSRGKQYVSSFLETMCLFRSPPASLCYALLPFVFDQLRECLENSIVLCISPLTALMMEQHAKFSLRGLRSEFIGQLQQDVQAMYDVQKGHIQLLYVSPESLLCNPQWREMLLLPVYQRNLVALVVDEAHCVTMW